MGLADRLRGTFAGKEHRPPKGIESCSFERVTGELWVSFTNGIKANIDSFPGPSSGKRIITITLVSGDWPKYKPKGTLTLREPGVLDAQSGQTPLSPVVAAQPDVYITKIADLLDTVDHRRVFVDSNWGWSDAEKPDKVRKYIDTFTIPMKDWVTAYQAAKNK